MHYQKLISYLNNNSNNNKKKPQNISIWITSPIARGGNKSFKLKYLSVHMPRVQKKKNEKRINVQKSKVMKKECLRNLFSSTVFPLINDPSPYLIRNH